MGDTRDETSETFWTRSYSFPAVNHSYSDIYTLMSNPNYVHSLFESRYLQSWTVYARWQGLVLWGLTCFTSTGTQWAVITEQNCRDTHGLGPGRVAVLWERCGRTPSSQQAPRGAADPSVCGSESGLKSIYKPPHEDNQQSAPASNV